MKKLFVTILLCAFAAALFGCQAAREEVYITPPPYEGGDDDDDDDDEEDSYLVGCAYYANWRDDGTGGWYGGGRDWRELPEFADRIPTNGLYSSQEVMDQDITTASFAGIDFWNILYYPHAEREEGVEFANDAVTHFMNSPNAGKMKFMIEITNHAPFNVVSVAEWTTIAAYVADCMTHPSYLKVDGRPVMKIHSPGNFYDDLKAPENDHSTTITRCNAAIGAIRAAVTGKGLENPIVAMGMTGNFRMSGSHLQTLNIDCTMQYNDVPSVTTYPYTPASDYDYSILAADERTKRMARSDDMFNYVPYSMSGWNGRPWKYTGFPSFKFPTREEWKASLQQMKADLDNTPNFGFPKKDGTCQRAFTIFAWNEFGEGGFIAPTAGYQAKYVEVIQEVFGNENN